MTDVSRTALLVMDYQQGIVDRLGSEDVLATAGEAIAAARAAGAKVIYVRVAFRAGFPEVSRANKAFGAVAARAAGASMDELDASTALHPGLGARPDEPVVVKRRVGAFSGSDLDVLLRAGDVDTLVLAGISTSGVVLSTLRLAADRDFRLTVLSDACADPDPEVHRVLLEKVFPRQADVMTVKEWAAGLT